MNRAEEAVYSIRETDELADGNSPVHRLSAGAKLIVTLASILTVMSFGKYDLPGVVRMVVYPAVLYPLSGISWTHGMRRVRFVFPLILGTGLLNPLFDRRFAGMFGPFALSAGWLSCFVIIIKGVLTLSAAYLLTSVTKIDDLCAALRRMHVPSVLVTVFLLTCRYITVMAEEVSVMLDAYHLRAPGQKGVHHSAWGSFCGQLLLRSVDKASELYSSMELRGFHGEFPHAPGQRMRRKDWLFVIAWMLVFIAVRRRLYDLF